MPEVPDNKPILAKEKKKDDFEIANKTLLQRQCRLLPQDPCRSPCPRELRFNEVVICDSALRAHDLTPREGALSRRNKTGWCMTWTDFLIALETVQIRSVRKIKYMRDWGIYYGTVDARIYPTVRIYLPNPPVTPMAAISANDSIFWEEAGTVPLYKATSSVKKN